MPTIVSGNTNVPAIMIGAKASDMIIADVDGAVERGLTAPLAATPTSARAATEPQLVR